MRSVCIFCVMSFVLVLALSACSGGMPSALTPTDDTLCNRTHKMLHEDIPILVSDFDSDGYPAAGWGTLGLWNLHLDPSSASGDLSSLRQGLLPDVLEVVEITNFLQLAPCTNCVKLRSVALNEDGNLVASIGIKHPFEEGDPFKPITGRNRGDLHVFNVEGIVVSNNPPISFPGIGQTTANFRLLNASGYTGYLDPVLDNIAPTAASIHPYILHFDDYSDGNFDPNNPMGFSSVTIPHPSGNLVMPMGSDYDFKDYIFDVTDKPMDFIFAIGCTYAVSSARKVDRFDPEFRVPQHLKKAASEVWIDIFENNLAGEKTDSSAKLQINVVDISHGVPVGDALNEMLADSSVSGVTVEVPGVTAGGISFSTTPISGTGHDPEDPLIFEGEITNAAGGDEGTYLGLVKVTDSYPPGLNESPLLDGMDGIERVSPIQNPLEGLFVIPEFATYQVFTIDVETGNEPPVAVLKTDPDPPQIDEYNTVDFDATDSYDPDGTIVLYEFDFDWDGNEVNFNPEETNTTGLATSPIYYTPGTYIAGLRVTDNEGAIDYDQVMVEVSEGCVIHVDGNNTSGPWDGSLAHPFMTVQDAVDVAYDDCLIYIHPGVITEVASGPNEGSQITISNINNLTIHGEDLPVVRMARSWCLRTGQAAFHAFSSPGLTIRGVEITPYYAYQSAIWLENSPDATIEDCVVSPSPEYGFLEFLRASGSHNLVARNNTTDGMVSYSTFMSLFVLSNCNNSVITLNSCKNLLHGGYNINQTGEDYIALYSCSNVEISKNVFGEHNRSVPSNNYVQHRSIYITGGSGNIIRNNLIYDNSFYNSGDGLSNNYAIVLASTSDAQVYNNTIDRFGRNNTGEGVTSAISMTNSSGAQIYNNIFSNLMATQSGTCYGVNSNVSAEQTYSDVWNLVGATSIRYAGSATEGVGGINVDPVFNDPENGDYTLAPGSPCIGTGLGGDDMGCYGGSDPLP